MEPRLPPVAAEPDASLLECGLYKRQEVRLFGGAGDFQALELALEPDIDVERTGIGVEVKKCAAAARKRAALALAQLRQLAQLYEQRL
jgi:hypothetical protein